MSHEVWPMVEIDIVFRGPLPEYVMDESRIPAKNNGPKGRDCLNEHESVKTLVLDLTVQLARIELKEELCSAVTCHEIRCPGNMPCACYHFSRMPLGYMCNTQIGRMMFVACAEVLVYDYTIHFTAGSLADKMGCCMFFRRSFKGFSLLAALLRNLDIARIPSDSLTQLLKVHNINMRKTATKVCKIRSLCQVETVLKDLSAEEVKALEELMKNMESKKKKTTTKMKTWTSRIWTLVY